MCLYPKTEVRRGLLAHSVEGVKVRPFDADSDAAHQGAGAVPGRADSILSSSSFYSDPKLSSQHWPADPVAADQLADVQALYARHGLGPRVE